MWVAISRTTGKNCAKPDAVLRSRREEGRRETTLTPPWGAGDRVTQTPPWGAGDRVTQTPPWGASDRVPPTPAWDASDRTPR
jgi:hypothetical protein